MSRFFPTLEKFDLGTLRGKLNKKKHKELLSDREIIVEWVRKLLLKPELEMDEIFDIKGLVLMQIVNVLRPTEKIKMVMSKLAAHQTTQNLQSYQKSLVEDFGYNKNELFEITTLLNDRSLSRRAFVPSLTFLYHYFEKNGFNVKKSKQFRAMYFTKQDLKTDNKLKKQMKKKDPNKTYFLYENEIFNEMKDEYTDSNKSGSSQSDGNSSLSTSESENGSGREENKKKEKEKEENSKSEKSDTSSNWKFDTNDSTKSEPSNSEGNEKEVQANDFSSDLSNSIKEKSSSSSEMSSSSLVSDFELEVEEEDDERNKKKRRNRKQLINQEVIKEDIQTKEKESKLGENQEKEEDNKSASEKERENEKNEKDKKRSNSKSEKSGTSSNIEFDTNDSINSEPSNSEGIENKGQTNDFSSDLSNSIKEKSSSSSEMSSSSLGSDFGLEAEEEDDEENKKKRRNRKQLINQEVIKEDIQTKEKESKFGINREKEDNKGNNEKDRQANDFSSDQRNSIKKKSSSSSEISTSSLGSDFGLEDDDSDDENRNRNGKRKKYLMKEDMQNKVKEDKLEKNKQKEDNERENENKDQMNDFSSELSNSIKEKSSSSSEISTSSLGSDFEVEDDDNDDGKRNRNRKKYLMKEDMQNKVKEDKLEKNRESGDNELENENKDQMNDFSSELSNSVKEKSFSSSEISTSSLGSDFGLEDDDSDDGKRNRNGKRKKYLMKEDMQNKVKEDKLEKNRESGDNELENESKGQTNDFSSELSNSIKEKSSSSSEISTSSLGSDFGLEDDDSDDENRNRNGRRNKDIIREGIQNREKELKVEKNKGKEESESGSVTDSENEHENGKPTSLSDTEFSSDVPINPNLSNNKDYKIKEHQDEFSSELSNSIKEKTSSSSGISTPSSKSDSALEDDDSDDRNRNRNGRGNKDIIKEGIPKKGKVNNKSKNEDDEFVDYKEFGNSKEERKLIKILKNLKKQRENKEKIYVKLEKKFQKIKTEPDQNKKNKNKFGNSSFSSMFESEEMDLQNNEEPRERLSRYVTIKTDLQQDKDESDEKNQNQGKSKNIKKTKNFNFFTSEEEESESGSEGEDQQKKQEGKNNSKTENLSVVTSYQDFLNYLQISMEEIYPKPLNKYLNRDSIQMIQRELACEQKMQSKNLEPFMISYIYYLRFEEKVERLICLAKNTGVFKELKHDFSKKKIQEFQNGLRSIERNFDLARIQSIKWTRIGECFHKLDVDNTGTGMYRTGKIWFEKNNCCVAVHGVGSAFKVDWKKNKNLKIFVDTSDLRSFMITNGKHEKIWLRAKSAHQKRVIVFLLLIYYTSKGKNALIGNNKIIKKNWKVPNEDDLDLSVLPPYISPEKDELKYLMTKKIIKNSLFVSGKGAKHLRKRLWKKRKVFFLIHVVVPKTVCFDPALLIIERNSFTLRVGKKVRIYRFHFKNNSQFIANQKNGRIFTLTTNKKTKKSTFIAKSNFDRDFLLSTLEYFNEIFLKDNY
ncbi:hypothetical protein M0813_08132 [Anaeramoeba flamelloides]|uniref:Uncharacterized protein n=1 Tax=Anaeramoeba flamelloides TaxID=1746091 RepID=A0ABQ8XA84_9EUKA|nr:hypothetical protein M0813_08132 [Anaeramoeba flamelloides]